MSDRITLRRTLRARRRALHPRERKAHTRLITRNLLTSALLRRCRHIALYLCNDGEVCLDPLPGRLRQMGKTCYLPALDGLKLRFLPYHKDTPLRENRFGIPEPALPLTRAPDLHRLDLVLTPLVAFDATGNRLGMGGGYYDRTFAYYHRRSNWHRPPLLGVAFQLQQLDTLPDSPWDVPLYGIATETGITRFPGGPR